MHLRNATALIYSAIIANAILIPCALAQPPDAPARARAAQATQIVSPEVAPDRRVTFRIVAPKAEEVRLSGSDIPGNGRGAEMTKDSNGGWADPRNPAISESNNNVWSLVNVPDADFMDTKEVPHGAVSTVTYYSTTLKRFRRLHIYTPPSYELGRGKFPVFYLLHGASDSDDSWTSVGRAGFILDNLIAAKKAKPMLVVMPAGHTGPFRRGGPRPAIDEFAQDFVADIMPLVEKNYRVLSDRKNRAIAGLSMGGGQTLNIGIPHLNQFAYLGVFSSGVFGIVGGARASTNAPAGATFEEQHQARLDDKNLKKGLKLFWFATGKEDSLIPTSRATVAMFKKHGFEVTYKETEGAHTWMNWREYLQEFTPQLFQ